MQIGYARVSTDAQDLITQRELLAAAGCSRIFAEKITGTRADFRRAVHRLISSSITWLMVSPLEGNT